MHQTFFEKIIVFINSYKIYIIIAGLIIFSALFLTFSAENPTSFKGMIKKSESYVKKGQLAFALEEYNKITRLYPGDYDVHVRLAELYEELDEPEKAKTEYIRAIRVGHRHRHEATLALAKMYVKENRFDIAEDIIKEIKNIKDNQVLKEIGDIYYSSGEFLSKGDRLEAIRKFKKARNYYKKAQSDLSKQALGKINILYAEISDMLVENNESKKAIEILNLSMSYEDNALAHYKLAKIYEKKSLIDKAIKEYSESFKMDSEVGNINAYAALLMKEAETMELNGKKVKAELYRLKARKINAKLDIPDNPDKKILFSLIAIKINEDIDRDVLIPGIIFNLTNITDKVINNIKVKVIFYEGNKPFSTRVMNVADEEYPLQGDAKTSDISIYSNQPVRHVFDEHDLWAKVYVSQENPDKWKLFRNIPIIKEKKSILIKE